MYIKLTNGKPEKYSIDQLRKDNPQTSFPSAINNETLSEFGVFQVLEVDPPSVDAENFKVVETDPVEIFGVWYQSWEIIPLSENEKLSLKQEKDEIRRIAYQREADPLFFKWQRGEATKEEWLAKVAEIKNRT